MIVNYQSGIVWEYFMKNPYVLAAVKRPALIGIGKRRLGTG